MRYPLNVKSARLQAVRDAIMAGDGKAHFEILGAGMVHPAVFENVGYDTSRVTGFAFGVGIERIAMLKYGIDDIRIFYDNDMRFIGQFVSY